MERLDRGRFTPWRSAARGLAWFGGVIAWTAAVAVGAAMAVVFAATLLVITLMASALVALTAAAMRTRRAVRATVDPGFIEARQVGGHSWVAYGWDGGSHKG
ncbi:MAG: hypothetical protein H0X27_14605 [Caulobacteraceae bacterium]|nr:hypothetical protein [Caulobacteraceae bacterium]